MIIYVACRRASHAWVTLPHLLLFDPSHMIYFPESVGPRDTHADNPLRIG